MGEKVRIIGMKENEGESRRNSNNWNDFGCWIHTLVMNTEDNTNF